MNLSEVEFDPTVTLDDINKLWTLKALAHFENNKAAAAKSLGITIKTIYNRLQAWSLWEQFCGENRGRPKKLSPQAPVLELPRAE